MKILTVRQPWALHLIQSGKDVENRSRNIAGSYRGPVAIHAGLKMDDEAMRALPRRAPNGLPRAFWTGEIIGVADLVDVNHADSCGGCSEWAFPDHHHLVFANPRPVKRIIKYRGALGLRTITDEAILKQLEES